MFDRNLREIFVEEGCSKLAGSRDNVPDTGRVFPGMSEHQTLLDTYKLLEPYD
jgi:hypothetical protein